MLYKYFRVGSLFSIHICMCVCMWVHMCKGPLTHAHLEFRGRPLLLFLRSYLEVRPLIPSKGSYTFNYKDKCNSKGLITLPYQTKAIQGSSFLFLADSISSSLTCRHSLCGEPSLCLTPDMDPGLALPLSRRQVLEEQG